MAKTGSLHGVGTGAWTKPRQAANPTPIEATGHRGHSGMLQTVGTVWRSTIIGKADAVKEPAATVARLPVGTTAVYGSVCRRTHYVS
jgi:hypothetical protein